MIGHNLGRVMKVVPPLVEIPAFPPNQPSLWAWFKFNEGTGYLVTDYGPVGVPAYVNGQLHYPPPPTEVQRNNFWNTNPGFGHNGITYGTTRYTDVGRSGRYSSVVAFIRPLGPCSNITALQIGSDSFLPGLNIYWNYITPYRWGFSGYSWFSFALSPDMSPGFGNWYCVYAYQSKDLGSAKLYIRESEGPFVEAVSITKAPATGNSALIYALAMFGGTNSTCAMDGGDFLFYADETPSGILTLTQANTIYDNLKVRYGMT